MLCTIAGPNPIHFASFRPARRHTTFVQLALGRESHPMRHLVHLAGAAVSFPAYRNPSYLLMLIGGILISLVRCLDKVLRAQGDPADGYKDDRESIAHWTDSQIVVPGGNIGFPGFSPIGLAR